MAVADPEILKIEPDSSDPDSQDPDDRNQITHEQDCKDLDIHKQDHQEEDMQIQKKQELDKSDQGSQDQDNLVEDKSQAHDISIQDNQRQVKQDQDNLIQNNQVQDNKVQGNQVQDNQVQNSQDQDNQVQDNQNRMNQVQDNWVQDNQDQPIQDDNIQDLNIQDEGNQEQVIPDQDNQDHHSQEQDNQNNLDEDNQIENNHDQDNDDQDTQDEDNQDEDNQIQVNQIEDNEVDCSEIQDNEVQGYEVQENEVREYKVQSRQIEDNLVQVNEVQSSQADDCQIQDNEDHDNKDHYSLDLDLHDDDSQDQDNHSLDQHESEIMQVEYTDMIIKHINDCLVQKLSKNYDESDTHEEVASRNDNLDTNIKTVIEDLEKYEIKGAKKSTKSEQINVICTVASLLNLYKELLCSCSWNSERSKECAAKLNEFFNVKYKVKLENMLKKNEICDNQAVYDKCLDDLCKKLTLVDFKKYPGQVEVYCDLVQNFKNFNVTLNPIKILPVALILTDDYIESNKIKGLQCCEVLLQNLNAEDFEHGNYYDVIYISIKNALTHKDLKITELSQSCALELIELFPSEVKDEKLDEMYMAALDYLSTESNLYRKALYFNYTKNIIEMLEIKCAGKSLFKTIISDTIDNCLIDSVAEILLIPSLECLEEWIKYCWPVWKLSVDYKVLCALLKYYGKCNTGDVGLLVQKLIVTLVALCTPEEQQQFATRLEGIDEEEKVKIDNIRKDIGVDTNSD